MGSFRGNFSFETDSSIDPVGTPTDVGTWSGGTAVAQARIEDSNDWGMVVVW